jgi:hypothetical protein
LTPPTLLDAPHEPAAEANVALPTGCAGQHHFRGGKEATAPLPLTQEAAPPRVEDSQGRLFTLDTEGLTRPGHHGLTLVRL